MVFIKGLIVVCPVGEFNINRWKACFHQLKVNQQTSGSAITINEGMNTFERNMKTG